MENYSCFLGPFEKNRGGLMANDLFDLAIIGAGPVGLFAQYYAGLRELKTALIEATPQLGGQITALYPEKNILDVAGFPGISGRDLVKKLQEQANLIDGKTFLNSNVTNLRKQDSQFELEINNHALITAKSVIIASGNGSFSPRKLSVPGAEEMFQAGRMRYLLPNLAKSPYQDFTVVGGGNTAVDYALELIEHDKQVHLIHRRDRFRALESSITKLQQNPLATFETPNKIVGLQISDGRLAIQMQNIDDDRLQTIVTDQLIVGYGFTASSASLDLWETLPVKINNGFVTDPTQMTSIPGIFAVGDASSYAGKADIIASGFGEVPTAANSAVNYFDPERGGPAHSTSLNLGEFHD